MSFLRYLTDSGNEEKHPMVYDFRTFWIARKRYGSVANYRVYLKNKEKLDQAVKATIDEKQLSRLGLDYARFFAGLTTVSTEE